MSLSYAELESFYETLVSRARERGITCAITSGMACVHYGVAQSTKDCDLLCKPEYVDPLLQIIRETRLQGTFANYRGHITPPLDARWLHGGWTSHFVWRSNEQEAYLDVFGAAPRASTRWEDEVRGFYSGPHIVAEMKRTDRDKDWPFATALGVKLLEMGDSRGWLHIFHYETLLRVAEKVTCPPEIITQRPVLELLAEGDDRLEVALRSEMEFWQQLDYCRLRVYEKSVRPYMLAVKRDRRADEDDLTIQHQARVEHAEAILPRNPLRQYGLDKLIAEARERTTRFVPPNSLQWLPNTQAHFIGLLDE